jgi:nitronate monooxygenase
MVATAFTRQVGIEVPLICGAMYPCSNPELVAAVSEAGGIGIVQPLSLVYVHKHDFRAGLSLIRSLTSKPFGLNLLIEKSSRLYEERNRRWLDVALEMGVRFFITALGNPKPWVDRVHAAGGVVYHDTTDRRWALKALDGGVDGLICVNARAGGHAGKLSPEELVAQLSDLGKPLICAGGIGAPSDFAHALSLGYAGVQMGTRFIATPECRVHADYKAAIVRAEPEDIVLTDKLSGTPCAVIKTPYIEKLGLHAGPLARWMLRGSRTKRWMRSLYAVSSIWKLKRSALAGTAYRDFFQAGKSVGGIEAVEPAGEIVRRFAGSTAAVRSGAPSL